MLINLLDKNISLTDRTRFELKRLKKYLENLNIEITQLNKKQELELLEKYLKEFYDRTDKLDKYCIIIYDLYILCIRYNPKKFNQIFYFYNEFFTKPLSNKMTKEKFLQKAIILPIENNNFNFESFEPSFKLQELLKDNDSVNLIKSLYPFILKEFINENKKINDSFDKYKIAYNEAELSDFNKQWKVCLKNNFKDLLNGEFKEIVQQFNTQNLLNNFNNACPPSTHISTVKRHKI